MIRYKIDILEELRKRGYNTGQIRKRKIMGERTLQDLRSGKIVVGISFLNNMCKYLDLNVGDILEYVPDETPAANNNVDHEEITLGSLDELFDLNS